MVKCTGLVPWTDTGNCVPELNMFYFDLVILCFCWSFAEERQLNRNIALESGSSLSDCVLSQSAG